MQTEQGRTEVEPRLRLRVGEQRCRADFLPAVRRRAVRVAGNPPFKNRKQAGASAGLCTSTRPLVRMSIISFGLALAACSAVHRSSPAATAQAAESKPGAQAAAEAPNESTPSGTIQIDYAHKDDFVRSLTVTKFTSAHLIPIKPGEEDHGTSVVRFEGGVPVWQIRADGGVSALLAKLPLIHATRKYALKNVTYGELPKAFFQTVPESGPPEPLQPESFYVFTVERDSGSTSFEAVKVQSDGTLEGYDAQPRVGDSYALCCNVSTGFASPETP
jgi:hypothetical protein